MQDYEFIFSTALYNKLKDKIKGKIWTKCYNDELHVKIETRECGDEYEYVVCDFSNKILNGLNTDYITYLVLKDYSDFINNIFFK